MKSTTFFVAVIAASLTAGYIGGLAARAGRQPVSAAAVSSPLQEQEVKEMADLLKYQQEQRIALDLKQTRERNQLLCGGNGDAQQAQALDLKQAGERNG